MESLIRGANRSQSGELLVCIQSEVPSLKFALTRKKLAADREGQQPRPTRRYLTLLSTLYILPPHHS